MILGYGGRGGAMPSRGSSQEEGRETGLRARER